MPTHVLSESVIQNRIITGLTRSRYRELFSSLQPVSLSLCDVLYKAGDLVRYVYFPNDALISLVAVRQDEMRSFEVCIVGVDGMLGVPALQRHNRSLFTSIVRRPGTALRAKVSVVRRALIVNGQLQSSLFSFMNGLLVQVAQSAVCHNFHGIDERLARCLLSMNDQTRSKTVGFPATHEFLAQILGERRVSVTQAASRLRDADVISYGRGWMRVVNRIALEAASCSCYWTVSGRQRRLARGRA